MKNMPLHNKLSEDSLEAIARRFRALSEVSRLKIVQCLQSGDKNVTEIVELTGLNQPNVSRHLQILVHSGLIGRKRAGLNAQYRILDNTLSKLCSIVCGSLNLK